MNLFSFRLCWKEGAESPDPATCKKAAKAKEKEDTVQRWVLRLGDDAPITVEMQGQLKQELTSPATSCSTWRRGWT